MIIEVIVTSPWYGIHSRTVYLSYPLEKTALRQVGMLTKRNEPLPDFSTGDKNAFFIVENHSDGVERKIGAIRTRRYVVLVVGDGLEEEAEIVRKALDVSKEVDTHVRGKALKSLSKQRKSTLLRAINDQVFDYVRLVLFGEQKTGKSSIFELITSGKLVNIYVPSTKASVAPTSDEHAKLLHQKILDKESPWYIVANKLLTLYDLPGSVQYQNMWASYLKRAEVGILVLKSDKTGVVGAKKLLQQYRKSLPRSVVLLATHQDMPSAIAPALIEKALGLTTYGTVGTDLDRVEQLRDIVKTAAVY